MPNPITVEVIRNTLVAMMDEVEQNLVLTSYSPVVYEIRDVAAALIDPHGRIIAQGRTGLPVFLADLPAPVLDGLEIYGIDGFEPGDVVLTNHSGTCGQHLNNVVVYTPIFHQGELVAFMVTRTHWTDIGGAHVGSWDTESREIYGEGLQLRTLKICKAGVFDEELFRILRHNSRFHHEMTGDLNAQLAACRLGERRFLELLGKCGRETLDESVVEIWRQSERLARAAVACIPDGTYVAESNMDDDGVNRGVPIRIKVRVTVAGSEMTIDLSEVSDQVDGPINSGRSGGITASRVAFKYLTTPTFPADDGCFRPLTIELPPGTLISAEEPAPMGLWSNPLPTVIDTVLRALSEAIPEQIPAAHMGDQGPWAIYGKTDGRTWYHVDSAAGGFGASAEQDGTSAVKGLAHGQSNTIPTELEEARYPLRVLFCRLKTDSGGPGEFRGGMGSEKAYEVPQDCHCLLYFDRHTCPPWGLHGGGDAAASGAIVEVPGEAPREIRKVTALPLPAGSTLHVWSAGGGGYGDPSQRSRDRVEEDVRQGYVSLEAARRDYGVVMSDNGTPRPGAGSG